jgi:hypothetical protein
MIVQDLIDKLQALPVTAKNLPVVIIDAGSADFAKREKDLDVLYIEKVEADTIQHQPVVILRP